MFLKIQVQSSWCSELSFFQINSSEYMALQNEDKVLVFKPTDSFLLQEIVQVAISLTRDLEKISEENSLTESQYQAVIAYYLSLDHNRAALYKNLNFQMVDSESLLDSFDSLILKRSLKGDKKDQINRIFSLLFNESNPREHILDIYGENKKSAKAAAGVIKSADSLTQLATDLQDSIKRALEVGSVNSRSDYVNNMLKIKSANSLIDHIEKMGALLSPLLQSCTDVQREARSGSKVALLGSILSMIGCSPRSSKMYKFNNKSIEDLNEKDFDMIEAFNSVYGSIGVVEIEIVGLEEDQYVGRSTNGMEYYLPREKNLEEGQIYLLDVFSSNLDVEAA